MNKNIIIGIVVVAVVVGALIYLSGGTPPGVSPEGQVGGKPIVEVNISAISTNSTAAVNGTVNPNQSNTTFWYRYGEANNLNRETPKYTIGSGSTAIDAPSYVSGLQPSTTYQYQLVAQNSNGISESAVYSFKTTTEAPLPPGTEPVVETRDVTDVSRTIATIAGTVNSRGWAASYWFEYGETPNFGLVTDIESLAAQSASMPVKVFLRNLTPLTKYYFRLNAQNQFGTVNGEIMDFTTTGPLTALQPSVYTNIASKVTASSATLRGSVNPNAAQTTYWFEYGTASSLTAIAAKSTPQELAGSGTTKNSVSADITGLASDTMYLYRLVAKNEIGITYGDIVYFRTEK